MGQDSLDGERPISSPLLSDSNRQEWKRGSLARSLQKGKCQHSHTCRVSMKMFPMLCMRDFISLSFIWKRLVSWGRGGHGELRPRGRQESTVNKGLWTKWTICPGNSWEWGQTGHSGHSCTEKCTVRLRAEILWNGVYWSFFKWCCSPGLKNLNIKF